MSTVTLAFSDELQAAVAQRVRETGAASTQEYLLRLIEADCARGDLERILLERSKGPFTPLEPDWKEKVIQRAKAHLEEKGLRQGAE